MFLVLFCLMVAEWFQCKVQMDWQKHSVYLLAQKCQDGYQMGSQVNYHMFSKQMSFSHIFLMN
ncbi:hypothetical protein G209_24465 [Salmonella enterica subsp. enterica serovar Newport str. JS09102]|nr:hypothetical protein G209_24465 [Salmonella enterica subsp. enterica serovar Newport str. JS09102]